jgi:hypothetical protein
MCWIIQASKGFMSLSAGQGDHVQLCQSSISFARTMELAPYLLVGYPQINSSSHLPSLLLSHNVISSRPVEWTKKVFIFVGIRRIDL